MAGHIHTKHLARPDDEDKFRPLIDILPVLPGDPDLAAAKRTANLPWRLEFENLGGDLDFMKLDDTHHDGRRRPGSCSSPAARSGTTRPASSAGSSTTSRSAT